MSLAAQGVVSRAQFVRYMLVASGMVEEVEIAKLDSLFDALDADGSGSLDAADIRRGVVAGCNSQLHAGPGGRGRYVEVTTSSRTSSGPDSPAGGPSGFGTSFARSMLGGSGELPMAEMADMRASCSEDSESADCADAGAALLAQKARPTTRTRPRGPAALA